MIQWYNYELFQPHLDAKLLYSDADSLIYLIYTFNIYEFIKDKIFFFDMSDFPLDNIHNIPQVNYKISLKLKKEFHNNIIKECVGLKPQLYSRKWTIIPSKREQKEYKNIFRIDYYFWRLQEMLIWKFDSLKTNNF